MKNTGKKLMFNYIMKGFVIGAFAMIPQLFISYGYISHLHLLQLMQGRSGFFIFSIAPLIFAYAGYRIAHSKVLKQSLSRRLEVIEDERKVLQHELSEYQYALDLCAIITIIDVEGRIKKVNENFLHFTGYKAEDVNGRSIWRLPSSLQKPGVFDEIKNTLASGKVWTGEIEYYQSQTITNYTKATVVPLIHKELNTTNCLVIQYDITAEKNTELALRKSEKEKSIIISNTQTLICTHDLSGIITSINKTGVDILGYAPQEIIGKPLQAFLHSRYNMSDYLNLIKEKGTTSGYMKMVTRNKSVRTLFYKNVTCTDYDKTYIIGSAIDVTETIEAKKTIDDQKAFISRIVDESQNMICVMDDEYNISFLNKKMKSFFGLNELDNIQTIDEAVARIPYFQTLANIEGDSIDSSAKNSVYECRIVQPGSGIVKWFKVQNSSFGDSKTKFRLLIATDITEKHAAQLELIQARQNIEASLKVRENFIANMSHEIRTPLNAIIGFSELLGDTSMNDQQSDYLKTINNAGQNLLGIINDILDLSKLEAGQIQVSETKTDLYELVNNIQKLFAPRTLEKQIDLHIQIAPGLPLDVMADQVRLNQILINLVGNAIKFTNRGSVTIEVKNAGNVQGKVAVQFSVKDTGIGIDKDKLDVIFQRYSQASKDIHKLYGGTGLGLSISKSLIELLGGHINLSSEKGEGTTFSFTIPFMVAETQQTSFISLAQKDENIENPLRILLAEDNMTNAKLAMQILGKKSYKVQHVKDGTEVLQVLQHQHFDIILMDVQMVEMDGIEATKAIRLSGKSYSDLPIIALTAHSFQGERDTCVNAGMDAYVSKPYRPCELLDCIQKTMEIHHRKESVINREHSPLPA